LILLNSFLVFFLGIVLGSFANVCIHRLPKNKQVTIGRSFCPKCKKKIVWYDNIPIISFLSLNRKCRKCKKKISIQYPIVEILNIINQELKMTGLKKKLTYGTVITGGGAELKNLNFLAFFFLCYFFIIRILFKSNYF